MVEIFSHWLFKNQDKPLFLHILSETQGMARRLTGEEVFEQMMVPYLGKRVTLDQCAQNGFNCTDDK